MRKFFVLIVLISFSASTFATAVPFVLKDPKNPIIHADQFFVPVGKTGKKISLLDLSRISVKELQELTGRKLNFVDKMKFKVAQKKLRDNIDRDGTINNQKIQKAFKLQKRGGETGFHFGGFALGFFLGLIGVVIAYVIDDDYKKNRVKWAWIGVGLLLILNIILIVAVFNSTGI